MILKSTWFFISIERRLARFGVLFLFLCICVLSLPAAFAKDQLNWNNKTGRVSADIDSGELLPTLEQIASATGWRVFVEPDTQHKVSARFQNLPPGEALRMLLGDLNYALLPNPNNSRLLVFRTSRQNATREIKPRTSTRIIANELVIRLKPGANIDEIAKALGAKIVGKVGNLYRLRFEDVASTESARTSLAGNSEVESIENNVALPRPETPQPLISTSFGPPSLQIKPPANGDRVIVGLIDTAVQSLGPELDAFILEKISIAGEANLDPTSPSHGTSMLGILLASLANESKGKSSVQVVPVDVYGRNPMTSTFDVANGIAQAINDYDAQIINLSLGSEANSQFLADLIADAKGKNVLFIGAAGNQPVTTPYYPAALPEVLAVTATEHGQIAPYANRGDFVSLGAPGTGIVYYNGKPYYVTGTSAAAAYASGMAAGHLETTSNQKTEQYLRESLPVDLPK